MSKFINTTRNEAIDSIITGSKNRIKNQYYNYIEQKPVIVTYYNQNLRKSTLDEGALVTYSNLGSNSSIKYNKINNMTIHGIERISVNLDNGDYGLESDSIEGEAIIAPNTIVPYPNDYFSINHIKSKLLFKVLSVTFDTVDNDANLYKIQYKLDQIEDNKIQDQIIEEYEFLPNNVGTSYNPLVKISDYNYIYNLEDITDRLVKYYKSLFFNTRVQTFTLSHKGNFLYDAYLIEFLIRNKILDRDDDFLYITHQTILPATFVIEYDKTFFRYIEINDKNKFTPALTSQARIINNPLSILSSRIEDYFEVEYSYIDNSIKNTIYNIDQDLFDRVKNNILYDVIKDKDKMYMNIVIKYLNNTIIGSEDIKYIDYVDYSSNIELFYIIPIIIFILNKQIISILTSDNG